MTNQRLSPRLRSYLRAKVIFPNNLSVMDCIVRDISESGARLWISKHEIVPDRFDLYIVLKERTYPVAVRWRSEEEIGVEFLPQAADADEEPSEADLKQRVQSLEQEVADLRRLFLSLQSGLSIAAEPMVGRAS